MLKKKNISGKSNNEKGFTIAELMWALTLGILVMTAVYSIYEGSLDLYYMSSEQGIAQSDGRKAMRKMTQVLRGMQNIVAVDGSGYSITLNSDIDDDKRGETVTFSLEGTSLVYSIPEENNYREVIAQYVRNSEQNVQVFKYYARDGTLLTDSGGIIAQAYSVDIKLILDVTDDAIEMKDGFTRPKKYELNGSAQFRNREL